MKRFLFLLIFGTSADIAQAQNDTVGVYLGDDSLDRIFTVVQVEAQFPGGVSGWTKYVQENLNADLGAKYIPLRKGEKMAKQTAVVAFIVDKEGNISDVSVVNPGSIHRKLAEEAIRVIKNGPKWIPAMQNGRPVMSRKRQDITWVVTAD
ncbi:MAG: ferric siderophore transport system, periplasmic binding protein TonB [Chitinophagaceae bacterium]|jgi:protein TonB|nr:ferric siderophore transport system, periplasmic binding protein TonB [Chitinophagaceae bacterium]